MRRPAAALIISCMAMVVLASSPAAAHEGEGVLEVQGRESADPSTVSYVVQLTWTNDGHPAFDATVTATPIDPSGTPQTPVPMQFEGEDGRYSGTITYPSSGTWTVRFTSVSPSSTMEIVEEVAAPTSSPSTTSTTPSPTATTTPADVDDVQSERAAPATDDDGGADGGAVGLLLAAALAIVAVGAVIALRTRRSRVSDV